MRLRKTLAGSFAANFPGEVAAVLESLDTEEVAGAVSELPPDVAAKVLEQMAPVAVTRVVEQIEPEKASNIFPRLTFDSALSLLRRVTPERRDEIVKALPEEQADALGTVLEFPPDTAGALMDPRLLAVPSDLTVDEALGTLRNLGEYSHYNLYVTDRSQMLIGVLNLNELLRADSKDTLDTIMTFPRHQLLADTDRLSIVNHPGWRHVHSLPVVDRKGRFLGAVRYRAFRRLEEETRGLGEMSEGMTAQALGDLLSMGFEGLIDAIASAVAPRRRTDSPTIGQTRPDEEQ